MGFYRDEEKREYIREIKRDRKLGRNLFIGGLAGLSLLGLEYLTGISPEITNVPVDQMNFYQDLHLGVLLLSSLAAGGGASIYGITYLVGPKMNKTKSKENNLEKTSKKD